jgi:acylphosphatase
MFITRRIVVRGRVQGVWYRGWTVDQAAALGLDGWVRNRRDGSVEILASGSEEAIAALIERCHSGPGAARVEQVEVEQVEDSVAPGFFQKPTL